MFWSSKHGTAHSHFRPFHKLSFARPWKYFSILTDLHICVSLASRSPIVTLSCISMPRLWMGKLWNPTLSLPLSTSSKLSHVLARVHANQTPTPTHGHTAPLQWRPMPFRLPSGVRAQARPTRSHAHFTYLTRDSSRSTLLTPTQSGRPLRVHPPPRQPTLALLVRGVWMKGEHMVPAWVVS